MLTTSQQPSNSRKTEGSLTYIVRQAEKPYFLSSALTGGAPEVHFKTEQHTVAIHDMRHIEANVDREGFELMNHSSTLENFYDDQAITNVYNSEITNLLETDLALLKCIFLTTHAVQIAQLGQLIQMDFEGPQPASTAIIPIKVGLSVLKMQWAKKHMMPQLRVAPAYCK